MRAYLLIGVAALSLAACQPEASDQADLTAGPPIELGLAPAWNQLPAADPVPVYYAPEPVAYDYWNDAYDMNQSYYEQPPSYYNYGGATPLVWGQQPQQQPQSLTGTLTNLAVSRIVEALVGGGQREYFYRPGYEDPFFIRDPNYAYALDDGRLVAAYDPYGRLLGEPVLVQQAPIVGRYMVRADDLRAAAIRTPLQLFTDDDWRGQQVFLANRMEDEGWRRTWAPGANRSPVAIRRLAEVRARKELRDDAHAAWKAELKKAPKVVGGHRHADKGHADKADRGKDDRGKPDKGKDKGQKRADNNPGKGKDNNKGGKDG